MILTLVILGRTSEAIKKVALEDLNAQELILLSNPEAKLGGLGQIGNWYLDRARGDVLGLIHADVSLTPMGCDNLARAALNNGLSGIVGKRISDETVVWSKDVPPGGSIAVSTVDSCAVFIDRRQPYRFDTDTFDSFHLCVEDLCLQALQRGRSAVVPHAMAEHHPSEEQPGRDSWRTEHTRYWHKLRGKWPDLKFSTC